MKENRDLQRPVYVQKADMALADIVSGGKLVAEQMKKFILVNIKGQVMMEKVRVTTMSRETQQIPKMTTFGTRVWNPGTESQALTLSQRVKPGFDLVTLTSHEIVAQVDYPRFVLQDTVEGPQLHNTMVGYLGLHTKRDLEELICAGNTGSTDAFLALFNGIINGASTNTYAAGAIALSSTVLGNIRATMPSEYRNQPNLGYFTNEVAHDAYWTEVEARATNAGDLHLLNAPGLRFRQKDVTEVPLFPNNLGGGANETAVMYMDPKQFIFAFHEDVELWSEYNGRERVWTIVVTARVAQGYEHEPAVVKGTGVLGQ